MRPRRTSSHHETERRHMPGSIGGHEHKCEDVRCAQFGRWRGARREHPLQWGCDRRATKPQAKFGATRRAAGLFRPGFVARYLQIHGGICSSFVPRLGEKSLAANVIAFMFMTTKGTRRKIRNKFSARSRKQRIPLFEYACW